jgi:hypothetical protein
MVSHGNEYGQNKSNENYKATIPSSNYHRLNQLENAESFKYLWSILTNDGRWRREIKFSIAMTKGAFNKKEKKTLFTSKLDLYLRKELVKYSTWSMALYGVKIWTLRSADQKYLKSFEMWCWRRMEKIGWIHHVGIEEVLFKVNEQKNILALDHV